MDQDNTRKNHVIRVLGNAVLPDQLFLDLVFDILFPTGDDPREWSTISDIASMANSVVGVEVEQDPEALPLLSIEATVCQ